MSLMSLMSLMSFMSLMSPMSLMSETKDRVKNPSRERPKVSRFGLKKLKNQFQEGFRQAMENNAVPLRHWSFYLFFKESLFIPTYSS